MSNNDPRYSIVRSTQKALYKESGISASNSNAIIDLFHPENIAEYLGVKFVRLEEIPSGDIGYETAGMLDRDNKTIYVSNKFPIEQQRLTGMHEIIHWMLHKDRVMHRDRPIEKTQNRRNISPIEWEATHFACLYLMPEKMVKQIFSETFNLSPNTQICFDEAMAFDLNVDIEKLLKMPRMERTIKLVTATRFNGNMIMPIHKRFKISPMAMAIRLMELDLLAPDRRRGKPNLQIV